VYVAGDHACWTDHDLTKKVHKRRFGTVVRSRMVGLNKMMQEHAEEAQDWIMSTKTGRHHESPALRFLICAVEFASVVARQMATGVIRSSGVGAAESRVLAGEYPLIAAQVA